MWFHMILYEKLHMILVDAVGLYDLMRVPTIVYDVILKL